MKIHKLHIKNINSLYGDWEIDFQDKAFQDNPLFAIIGKTGSGKSTLLDAICFALYDRTDRMEAGSRHAIGSYHTTECMAELEFELGGITYLCHTSMSCPRSGVFANATPSTWIQWSENGVVNKIEKIKAKAAKVKEILGLEFEQFCQVILLAQGKFKAFLEAKPEDRAEILENITNTGIYSKIGVKINEMKKQCTDAIAVINTKLETIKALTEEEEEQFSATLKANSEEQSHITEKLKELSRQQEIWNKLQACTTRLEDLTKVEEILAKDELAFAPLQPKLESGRKAANVTPSYEAFNTVSQEQFRDTKNLEAATTQLPQLENTRQECEKTFDEKDRLWSNAVSEQGEREISLRTIDAIDADLTRLTQTDIPACEKRCNDLTKKIQKDNAQIASAQEQCRHLESARNDAEKYLSEHQRDSTLSVKNSGWEVQYATLAKAQTELGRLQIVLADYDKKLTAAQKAQKKADDDLAQKAEIMVQAEEAKRQSEAALETALAGHALEALKVAFEKQKEIVAVLKALHPGEVLKIFQEGAPCPVCGSIHHPYRALPETEKPADLANAEAELERCKKAYTDAHDASMKASEATAALANAQTSWQNASQNAENAKLAAAEKNDERFKASQNCDLQKQALENDTRLLQDDLASFGFTWNNGQTLPDAIRERISAFNTQNDLVNNFEKSQHELQQHLAQLTGLRDGKNNELKTLQNELQDKNNTLDQKRQERLQAYGEKKTSDERKALQKAVNDALQAKNNASTALTTARNNAEHIQTAIRALKTQIDNRQRDFEQKRLSLEAALAANGLTLQVYSDTVLSAAELAKLTETDTNLTTRRTNLMSERAQQQSNQALYASQLPEAFDVKAAQDDQAALESRKEALATENGSLKQKLNDNDNDKKARVELQQQHEALSKEAVRWTTLNSWIGGNRFRQMAQEYTFEILLSKANEQLTNMLNGRYQMCSHTEGEQLEIDVVDRQLGGDIRTSKNLSGGEQFIVSMSLALGLANMVGEKFQVDSLFLDEGFGTLDGGELEDAMNTLSQLKEKGKMVGIITHAERLQESIRTRISLEKHGNGASTLTGPGVKKLGDAVLYMTAEEKELLKKQQREMKALMKKSGMK